MENKQYNEKEVQEVINKLQCTADKKYKFSISPESDEDIAILNLMLKQRIIDKDKKNNICKKKKFIYQDNKKYEFFLTEDESILFIGDLETLYVNKIREAIEDKEEKKQKNNKKEPWFFIIKEKDNNQKTYIKEDKEIQEIESIYQLTDFLKTNADYTDTLKFQLHFLKNEKTTIDLGWNQEEKLNFDHEKLNEQINKITEIFQGEEHQQEKTEILKNTIYKFCSQEKEKSLFYYLISNFEVFVKRFTDEYNNFILGSSIDEKIKEIQDTKKEYLDNISTSIKSISSDMTKVAATTYGCMFFIQKNPDNYLILLAALFYLLFIAYSVYVQKHHINSCEQDFVYYKESLNIKNEENTDSKKSTKDKKKNKDLNEYKKEATQGIEKIIFGSKVMGCITFALTIFSIAYFIEKLTQTTAIKICNILKSICCSLNI